MSKIQIIGHMVIKNEDRFVWYSIASILPYIDQLLIADTGSSDETLSIVKKFRNKKIKLKKYKTQNADEISEIRQEQVKESNSDWIWIIDGDEIYPRSLINEIKHRVHEKRENLEGIVVGRYDLVGDIYHYQDNSAGYYNLFGNRGHFALRLINKGIIEGLHIEGIYPYEGCYDLSGTEIIYHDKNKFYFTKGNMHHAMYLKRSSHDSSTHNTVNRDKFKIETGIKLNKKDIPEIFFKKRPLEIPDVTGERSFYYEFLASIITPVKKIKRSLF